MVINTKDDLEIILFTYNRKKFLQKTMEQLLGPDSPIKDCKITILNNNSKDGTHEYLSDLSNKYPNIKYIKNNYNIWISTHIKGLEAVSGKYFWMLADDDVYDWGNWSEVEQAMNNEEDLICVANYLITQKNNYAQIMQQITFYPSLIYKSSNLCDEVFVNYVAKMTSMFPHFSIVSYVLNQGKQIYVCDKAIVDNGMIGHENDPDRDMTYTRLLDKDLLCNTYRNLIWGFGYAQALSMLKDNDMKEKALDIAQTFQKLNFEQYVKMHICESIPDIEQWSGLADLYAQLSPIQRKIFLRILLRYLLKNLYQKIKFHCSIRIRNDEDSKTLVIMEKIKIRIWKDIRSKKKIIKNEG